MKELSLLVWLTQLGLSVAVPPVLLILLAIWLRDGCGWGSWVIWAAVVLSIYSAVTNLLHSLKALTGLTRDKRDKEQVVAFNEHN